MIIQPDANPDPTTGKIPGRAVTDRSPVDPARWKRHLEGKSTLDSLGMVPINPDNNSVMWAAWDLDVYKDINHAAIAELLEKRGIPAVVCRSKSGGAHVFLFFTEWIPAYLAQDVLRNLRPSLGFSKKTEIYPKQRKLNEAGGEMGNWLNMPYFAKGSIHNRTCVTPEGVTLTAEEFITYAFQRRVSKQEFQAITPKKAEQILDGGPPCLNRSLYQGVKDYRNNTALALGVYFRKSGLLVEEAVERAKYMAMRFEGWEHPPKEMLSAIENAYKQSKAHYSCKDEALERFCDMAACKKCKYGIKDPEEQAEAQALTITELIHYHGEPDWWSVTTSLGTVRVTTKQLCKVDEMIQAYISQAHGGFPLVKYKDWMEIVNDGMTRKVDNEPSKQLDPAEQVKEILEEWILKSATVDLLRWNVSRGVYLRHTPKGWQAVFQFHELMKEVRAQGYKDIKEAIAHATLGSMGGESIRMSAGLSKVNVWAIPLSVFPDSSLTDEWIRSKTIPPKQTTDDQV